MIEKNITSKKKEVASMLLLFSLKYHDEQQPAVCAESTSHHRTFCALRYGRKKFRLLFQTCRQYRQQSICDPYAHTAYRLRISVPKVSRSKSTHWTLLTNNDARNQIHACRA